MTVVVTAGHVDHGKSTLVRGLTGVDPDRLPEEQRRGMTLDLGFASAVLPSGRVASFVDVPGHERLVGTMVAGAGAAAGCLFAVDGREGWRAQSEEHLRILRLLGIDRIVVAVTHGGGADVRSHVPDAVVVDVDLPAGVGREALVAALDELVDVAPPPDLGAPRLWLDRAFTVVGAGTVVTGTLVGGSLAVGDELLAHPLGRRSRVRRIEEHGVAVERLGPGRRAALNLVGVPAAALGRGDVLAAPDHPVHDLVLADLEGEPGRSSILHVGTRAMAVRVGPKLRLPVALPLAPGDRFVVRDAGRRTTVGGGTILGPVPPRVRPTRTFVPSPYLEELRAHLFDPPAPPADKAALGALRAAGLAVSAGGVWFAAEALAVATERLAPALPVTVAEARDLLGSSRKPTLALLELLDARGVTVRRGDRRFAGPGRSPPPPSGSPTASPAAPGTSGSPGRT